MCLNKSYSHNIWSQNLVAPSVSSVFYYCPFQDSYQTFSTFLKTVTFSTFSSLVINSSSLIWIPLSLTSSMTLFHNLFCFHPHCSFYSIPVLFILGFNITNLRSLKRQNPNEISKLSIYLTPPPAVALFLFCSFQTNN